MEQFIHNLNIQFPDKSGYTLRYNPASGISAPLRPAKLVRVGIAYHDKKFFLLHKIDLFAKRSDRCYG